MRITCDATCSMGYIYLMPPKKICPGEEDGNKIERYFEMGKLSLPIVNDPNIIGCLERIPIADKTYLDALNAGEIDEEYLNDKRFGYIKGIELNLTKEQFLNRIQHDAFEIFNICWRNKPSIIATVDTFENVFDTENIIYPMNAKMDTFLVLKIKMPYNQALIKALISSRYDLYPLDYLKTPKYILWEQD